MDHDSALPVAIIGAGPIGLAAAAHLAERHIPFVVFEAGSSAGHHLAGFAHVRLFSPWRFNRDQAATRLLNEHGWTAPDDDRLPTAGETVEHYLLPLAKHPRIAPNLHLAARVVAVSRVRHDKVKTAGRSSSPFLLQVERNGQVEEHRAGAVIDASGTWSMPNPAGSHGLPAFGEREHADRIAYGMPDIEGTCAARYGNRKVLVVGAGHSAIGNLIALASLAGRATSTRIAWALRRNDLRQVLGGGTNDELPARGALGTQLQALIAGGRLAVHRGFHVDRIGANGRLLRVVPDDPTLPAIDDVDEIIVATGSRPELGLVRELRTRFDPILESTDALAPLIDPNLHSCGTVRPHGHRELAHPEEGYYAIGAKAYGRAPNFLMATGFEQARSVVAAIAGDLAAADGVQLSLPETGVCSSDFQVDGTGRGVACCGGPAAEPTVACCAAEEAIKAQGGEGCGCPTTKPTTKPAAQRLAAIKVATSATPSCCTAQT